MRFLPLFFAQPAKVGAMPLGICLFGFDFLFAD
jgi:hypothetical protein